MVTRLQQQRGRPPQIRQLILSPLIAQPGIWVNNALILYGKLLRMSSLFPFDFEVEYIRYSSISDIL